MKLIWTDLFRFENKYLISNTGKILVKKTGHILKQHVHVPFPKNRKKDRYLKVDLNFNRKHTRHFVHKLVLDSFLPCLPFGKMEVNHKDGNWRNNRLSNLEWVTRADNMNHRKLVINSLKLS